MIVDDSAPMRRIIRTVLAPLVRDEEVVECTNGLEAVNAYGQCSPRWVLMDIKMPEMDGLTATRTIRSRDPNARIILVSSFDDPDFRREAVVHGATAYVLKERLTDLITIMQ